MIETIREMANNELERANTKFNQFASPHEGYAVLLEEVEEVLEDINGIADSLEYLWQDIKCDASCKESIDQIEFSAEHAIEELVQVLAMCRKFIDGEAIWNQTLTH